MAPKGGKGGGGGGGRGGGGSVNVCPGAFTDEHTVTPFVRYVLFFIIYLGIFIAYFPARKRATSKPILGWVWLCGVLCMLFYYMFHMIADILRECDEHLADGVDTYYFWLIVVAVFYNLGLYLLLVLVTWTLNTQMRRHLLANSKATLFKIAQATILGVMFCLMAAATGIECYNYNVMADRYNGYSTNELNIVYQQIELDFAYYLLYLFAVLAAAAMAVLNLFSMRRKRVTTYNLPALIYILSFSTFFFALLATILSGSLLPKIYPAWLRWQTVQAFWYLMALFQAVAFITIMRIAKSPAFETLIADPVGYNNGAHVNGVNGYYESQPPVLVK